MTCGAAQIMRSRSVKIEPMNDGKACDSVLNQTENCHGLPKCEKAGTERDCKWSQWSQWSECTKCGGEMYRVRQVEDHAEYGGKNCTSSSAQEVKTCDKSCYENVHCTWSSWGDWSDCSQSCVPRHANGKHAGKRTRKRNLHVVPSTARLYEQDADGLQVEFQVHELYRRAQTADSRRWQEVCAAFALGCFSFLVGFGVLMKLPRRTSLTRLAPLPTSGSIDFEEDLSNASAEDLSEALGTEVSMRSLDIEGDMRSDRRQYLL